MKLPPWVNKKDMYFSIGDVPSANGFNEVMIYCSELEVAFPARGDGSTECKLFSTIEGTMAQNHQKTEAQIFFRYLNQSSIVPLTGTCSEQHMKEDLSIQNFELSSDELKKVSSLLIQR